MPKAIAIIPARGGSKGIRNKNLKKIGGLPLVAHAILAARGAYSIDAVIVSTDDDDIGRWATAFGALVIRRPEALSGDSASSESALLHALESCDEVHGLGLDDTDVVAMLQCTAPLMISADIEGTLAPVLAGNAESAFAAGLFEHFVWEQDADGARGVGEPPGPRLRRQDAPPRYLEAGSVYAMQVGAFRREEYRFCGRTEICEIPADRIFEIDTPTELDRARVLWPHIFPTLVAGRLPDPLRAIVFDFDGVMTDDRVLISESGDESVSCSRADGMGLERLRAADLTLLVLSKERNPVVTTRCRKLGLDVLQGRDDKLTVLRDWANSRDIDPASMIYVGNDVNDLECMNWVGCSAVPSDAHADVLAAADVVLPRRGGRGAVRALADAILS